MIRVGANVRALRKRAGLTQALLAERVGMARTTVVAIEQNKRALRDRADAAALAAVLGCTPEELVDGPAPPADTELELYLAPEAAHAP